MFRKLMRAAMTVVGAIVGYGVFMLVQYVVTIAGHGEWVHFSAIEEICIAALFAIIFGLIFFRLTPALRKQSTKVANNIETDLQKVSTNDIVLGTIGLIAGLIIAFLISRIYAGIMAPFLEVVLNVVSYIILGYLGIVIATRKGKDLKNSWLSARRVSSSGGRGRHKTDATPKIFDTSVIIDGRIADIMKTGFIEGPIVIPEFVLVELRHIADSSDALKRNRGRRGLDILNKIQGDYGIEIYNTTAEKALDEIP